MSATDSFASAATVTSVFVAAGSLGANAESALGWPAVGAAFVAGSAVAAANSANSGSVNSAGFATEVIESAIGSNGPSAGPAIVSNAPFEIECSGSNFVSVEVARFAWVAYVAVS